MLKASIVRSIPLYRAASTLRATPVPCLLGAPCRTFMTSPARLNTSKQTNEGSQRRESQLFTPCIAIDHSGELAAGANSSQALTKQDGVSTVPTMVRGDWVLFHPVYTPEELKAVEVSPLLGIYERASTQV